MPSSPYRFFFLFTFPSYAFINASAFIKPREQLDIGAPEQRARSKVRQKGKEKKEPNTGLSLTYCLSEAFRSLVWKVLCRE